MGAAALLILALTAGCSDPRNQVFNGETGKHAAEWLPAQHANITTVGTTSIGAAIVSTSLCIECHGEDLGGGISGVSCTSCHLGGPTSIHPASWIPIVLTHGPSVSTGATTSVQCANQYCHGASLTGVAESGPSCSSCHSWPWDPASIHCDSCHAIPPAGTRYPNMAGRHTVHTAITGTSGTSCSPCHNGSDGASGTVIHYDNVVDVAFLPAYNAKTGTAAYNSGGMTCSQASCHGGQTTPAWQTGLIDVNTQCTSCHAYGTAQYNSFNSGEHNKHVNEERFACTECHDTAKLAGVHFNGLDSIAMNEAYLTLRNVLNYTGTAGTTGNCTITCHGKNHNPETW